MSDESPAAPAGAFEFLSIPYVIGAGDLARAGTCVRLGGDSEVTRGMASAGGALLHTVATIAQPSTAMRARRGDRFVFVRPGAMLPGLGRVVVPTGVVRVTSNGTPAEAEVVAQFDVISCSDAVLAASDIVLPADAPPAPVSAGPSGRVVWVDGDAILSSLQQTVIVDLGASAGVRPGDRVSIYAANGSTEIAAANVVRVDGLTASALFIRRPQAGIVAGLAVRVTAKIPD